MKHVITCIFLVFYFFGSSQTQSDPRAFASTITADDLRKHLFTLAAPDMQGRETATKGQENAASYLREQLRQTGMLPGWNTGYLQNFPVYQDSLIKATLSINGAALVRDTDYVVSNNSNSNVSFMASEVLYVGYGLSDSTRDDYKDVNARGKIVMVTPGSEYKVVKGRKVKDPVPDYITLQRAAQKNGAIAMLIVDKSFPRPPGPAKGPMYVTDPRRENIPNTFFISDSIGGIIMGSDYNIAKRIMKTGPPPPKSCYVSVLLELDKSTERLESSNVIGIIEGTDRKDEAVVLTAHYDHLGQRDSAIYYGADDDASGTSTLLEIAEAFSIAVRNNARPRRSVVIMAVSGEEKGLWGSSYYTDNPVFPLEKTSVNLNIDMIGRVETGRGGDSLNYIYLVGDNRISSELRPLSESVNSRYAALNLDYKFNDPNDPMRIYYRSDHYNFAKNGVPVIFYFNGLHEDYHRPTDTPEKINYELLAKRARLVFCTAWEIANRDELLTRENVDASGER